MAASLLKIDQLHVNVEEKEILHGIDLEINKGETHVLMGPNGAGKVDAWLCVDGKSAL